MNGESRSSTGERMRAGTAWSLRASSSSIGGGWLRRQLDFKRYPGRWISNATPDFKRYGREHRGDDDLDRSGQG
jgi:hypothetical protein